MTEQYKPPTTRLEAINEIIQTGATISALLAVAEAFPLEGERDATDKWLRALLEVDPDFHRDLVAERDRYLVSWGLR